MTFETCSLADCVRPLYDIAIVHSGSIQIEGISPTTLDDLARHSHRDGDGSTTQMRREIEDSRRSEDPEPSDGTQSLSLPTRSATSAVCRTQKGTDDASSHLQQKCDSNTLTSLAGCKRVRTGGYSLHKHLPQRDHHL